MIKRFLPIYHTGWFYLLLLFWGGSFWYASIGGLNQINQLNIQWLSQLESSAVLSDKKQSLDVNDIITLHSEFNGQDIKSVTTLLSYYPNSQITLLGQQSSDFMKKLEVYLSSKPRNSKIVIGSSQVTSASPLKSMATMPFSPLLNWFRFSSKTDTELLSSKYFIFSPLLQSERQTFPLIWRKDGMLHLTLLGEIVKQLSPNTELLIKQDWQLSLLTQVNTLAPKKYPLGFFGEVFISANLPTVNQINQVPHERSGTALPRLSSVSQFIQQYSSSAYTNSRPKYKVIFITDNPHSQDKILKPLLSKLVQEDYIYQSLLIILFAWLLLIIGISLTWFIGQLSLKQQSISVLSYVVLLFILQYFFFNQRQWLEVTPIIISIMGTWLLLLAYQKEYKLFLAALNYQMPSKETNEFSAPSNSKVKSRVKSKIKAKLQKLLTNKRVKSAQVKYSNSSQEENTIAASHNQLPPINRPLSESESDIEQTLVIVDNPVNSKTSMNQQMSVENFGRYQVEGVLGKGAMGIVYQGVDPKINRHVAIKTLQLSDDIDSPEFGEAKARFFREAQTAGGLSHANIVTIYDVGEDNHLGYIAMDLLTGAPLSLFTQTDKILPTPLVYQLLIQITDALEYAHNQNVVHRDIKPANIIYDDDLLKVTVTDFGIAYVSDNSNTRTGIIMGSPYYMSPEQILGLKVDGRSDIFSLGVTFYQLLCGHLPFEGESIATVAYQITKAKAIAVNQRNTNLPTSAMRICSKAMHKDIDKRFQSMSEFRLALTNALKRDFKITAN